MAKQTITKIANALQGNSYTKALLSQLEGSLSQYIKFFALNGANGQDLAVLAIPVPVGATLPELQSAVVSDLQAQGSTFHASRTSMGGKAALRIDVSSYHISVDGQSAPPQSQFYVLEDQNAVGIDISGASPATINAVVRSVRFTR
jgi:hypothetical protein